MAYSAYVIIIKCGQSAAKPICRKVSIHTKGATEDHRFHKNGKTKLLWHLLETRVITWVSELVIGGFIGGSTENSVDQKNASIVVQLKKRDTNGQI